MTIGAALLLAVMRAVVLTVGEEDPGVLEGVRALGADAVFTFARPSARPAAAAAAGLEYFPFSRSATSTALVTRLPEAVVAIPGIAGFHFRDEDVVEGYTPAEEQGRAYTILKALFPAAVLHAVRLDPVATDPAYLDGYFRPEFTDSWRRTSTRSGRRCSGMTRRTMPGRPGSLLAALALRMPAGKRSSRSCRLRADGVSGRP